MLKIRKCGAGWNTCKFATRPLGPRSHLLDEPPPSPFLVSRRSHETRMLFDMICVHTFWHECNFWKKIITMLCNDVKLQYFVNTASSSNSPCGGDMNAPKVSYHMFIFWSRDKFFVNRISRSVDAFNKTISDGGITVDFWIIKVHTSNWSSNSWDHRIVGDHWVPLDL